MMSVLKLQSLKVAKEERIKEPDSTFSILCSFEHSNASIAFCQEKAFSVYQVKEVIDMSKILGLQALTANAETNLHAASALSVSCKDSSHASRFFC